MAKIQCKMCGGLNDLPDGVTSGECQYCGSLTTFPKITDTQTEQIYSRAEHFRQANNFDKAVATYESILARNGEDPEAYWGLLISKYGIEYVEDPITHERIPTCHRVQFDSILADDDYQNALKYARLSRRAGDLQKGGEPHRRDPERHPPHLRSGEAVRCLHLLQGSDRGRRAHEGFRPRAGHLLPAHETGSEGLFRAHHAREQARSAVRTLHLRCPELREGHARDRHEEGVFRGGVGEK